MHTSFVRLICEKRSLFDEGGFIMSYLGSYLAIIGIIISVTTILYCLWHLFDLLADTLDRHEVLRRGRTGY